MIKLPKRYKNKVGKFIGGNLYVHRYYESLIPDIEKLRDSLDAQPFEWKYDVVKWNIGNGKISLIKCPSFDIEDEPVVGDSLITLYGVDKIIFKVIRSPQDPFIYHHKWLFVDSLYNGFDVDKSMKRSLDWMSLPGVDSSRIGKKSYWEKEVLWRIK